MEPSPHVQRKARRLLDENRVELTKIDPDVGSVEGTVRGDHDTYNAKVTMDGFFSCTCKWGDRNSHGSHLCSHALALKLTAGCWLGF